MYKISTLRCSPVDLRRTEAIVPTERNSRYALSHPFLETMHSIGKEDLETSKKNMGLLCNYMQAKIKLVPCIGFPF